MCRHVASLILHTAGRKVTYAIGSACLSGTDHMLGEKSQWAQNGTMFVDLDLR